MSSLPIARSKKSATILPVGDSLPADLKDARLFENYDNNELTNSFGIIIQQVKDYEVLERVSDEAFEG